jgi:hypothetical protein
MVGFPALGKACLCIAKQQTRRGTRLPAQPSSSHIDRLRIGDVRR